MGKGPRIYAMYLPIHLGVGKPIQCLQHTHSVFVPLFSQLIILGPGILDCGSWDGTKKEKKKHSDKQGRMYVLSSNYLGNLTKPTAIFFHRHHHHNLTSSSSTQSPIPKASSRTLPYNPCDPVSGKPRTSSPKSPRSASSPSRPRCVPHRL